jgi:hypothetical protein
MQNANSAADQDVLRTLNLVFDGCRVLHSLATDLFRL